MATQSSNWLEMYEAHRKRAFSQTGTDENRKLFPKGQFNETYVTLLERKLDDISFFTKVPVSFYFFGFGPSFFLKKNIH